ncbi:MAG: DUF368 domain-containing protein [Acidimicrobiales bacterium]
MIPAFVAQAVRGFLMGAADVVPGVSGGTVALVLGIYRRLIDSIREGAAALGAATRGDLAGAWSRVKSVDLAFLAPLLAGILVAVATLASVIEKQLESNAEEMAGLFLGLVGASVVVAWRLMRRRTRGHLITTASVGLVVFLVLGLQSGPVAEPAPLAFLGAGALAICAMILPGISGSFILLMIGMYASVLGAVEDRALADLGLTALGAVLGLAVFSTLLGRLLERAFDRMMAVLVGLMAGSLRVLWPWPNGVGVISDDRTRVVSGTGLDWPTGSDWLIPTLLAVLGAATILAVSWWADHRGHTD